MIDFSKIHYRFGEKDTEVATVLYPNCVRVKAHDRIIFKDSPLVSCSDGTARAFMFQVDKPGDCIGYAMDKPDGDGWVTMRLS